MEEAHSFWPPLTTVRQDFHSVGRLAMDRLFEQIAAGGHSSSGGVTTVPTELVVRESTGAPRDP
jgi:DNA-binding LacI/PurR family transcriptional regulator